MLTTKQGDGGYTRLADGSTVNKSTPQCNACGELDELNCVLGLVRVLIDRNILLRQDIEYIQSVLPKIMTEVSCLDRSSVTTVIFSGEEINNLDARREALSKKVSIPKAFVTPGDNEISARYHLARAVCRRTERAVVDLYNQGLITNMYVLMFLNRLSDYLYLGAIFTGGIK